MNELEKQSLDVVANNTLRYILEYGKEEGTVALVAQLLHLQVEIMRAVSDAADMKRMAQNVAAPTPMSEDMMKAMRINQAQMAMTVAEQWNTQEAREKNE